MVHASLLTAALFVSFVSPARASDAPRATRVRVRTPALGSLLETAVDRSPMFEALVRELEESDVIVYVDRSVNLPPSIRGTITFLGAGAGARYLNIWLNPRFTTDQTIVVLGHELQHAVEVARTPEVTTAEAFSRYYRHVGVRSASDNWDTREARHAERLIARELARDDRETLAGSGAGPARGRRGKRT
jgi:hypothetical protein